MITKPDCTPALEFCKSNVLTSPNTRAIWSPGLTGSQIPSLTPPPVQWSQLFQFCHSRLTDGCVYLEWTSWGVFLVSYLLSLTHPHHA